MRCNSSREFSEAIRRSNETHVVIRAGHGNPRGPVVFAEPDLHLRQRTDETQGGWLLRSQRHGSLRSTASQYGGHGRGKPAHQRISQIHHGKTAIVPASAEGRRSRAQGPYNTCRPRAATATGGKTACPAACPIWPESTRANGR